MATPPLLFLPGLANDRRLWGPQLARFPDALIPPWPAMPAGESLAAYAARLAASLRPDSDRVIAGISMGGMLAQELARLLRPRKVLLIASCRRGDQVSRTSRLYQRIADWLPDSFTRATGPTVMNLSEPNFSAAHRALYKRMLLDTDMTLLRRQAAAILAWPGAGEPPCRIAHLHGRRDRLIPCANVRPDAVVEDGYHLINWTHAGAVNDWLAREIES